MPHITDNEIERTEQLIDAAGDAIDFDEITQRNINIALHGLIGAVMVIVADQRKQIRELRERQWNG